jgi:hypothetical protein
VTLQKRNSPFDLGVALLIHLLLLHVHIEVRESAKIDRSDPPPQHPHSWLLLLPLSPGGSPHC